MALYFTHYMKVYFLCTASKRQRNNDKYYTHILIPACFAWGKWKQLFVFALHVRALLWNSAAQKLCGMAAVAKLVRVIHHRWGDWPALVAQLFGQWHQHASRGPYICCWAGDDRVVLAVACRCNTVWSKQTGRHETRGQRATSDILGGNEFEIEVDFISACSSTYLREIGLDRRKERGKCKLTIS